MLKELLAEHGLPPIDGCFDMQMELAELLERWTDAAEADRDADAAFIDRQITAAIERAKQQFIRSRP